MFQSPILFLFTIEITSTWQICYKEDMRKYIKWNCNIVDSNSVIIWNSAHLRQKKYCWNKILFLWWIPKKDLGHTHASGKNEWSHVVNWTTSLRATGKIRISGILLICWSQRDAMVLQGERGEVHTLPNYSCYNNIFCCISSHLAKELFFCTLKNYVIV